MLKILKTEWLKIRSYPAFWLVMATTALSYPGINYLFWMEYQEIIKKEAATGKMVKMLLGNPFAFPDTFHTTAFFSSIFVIIPAVVVIMLITNEFTYKTNRQNIIDGWSRNAFIMGKFMDVVIITLLVSFLYTLIAYFVGVLASASMSMGSSKEWRFIPLFVLQTFSQLSIAFLVGFTVRKAFIALGLFIFYYLILENISVALLQKAKLDSVARFLPIEMSDRMIPLPPFLGRFNLEIHNARMAAIDQQVVYTIIFTALIWGMIYLVNRKRDL